MKVPTSNRTSVRSPYVPLYSRHTSAYSSYKTMIGGYHVEGVGWHFMYYNNTGAISPYSDRSRFRHNAYEGSDTARLQAVCMHAALRPTRPK